MLLCVAGACSDAPEADHGAGVEPAADAGAAALETLRALGYTGWDPSADSGVAGVVRHEPEASPGYNLYTNDRDQVLLMDMRGRIVHRWHVPGRTNCEYAELLDEGRVLVVSVDQGLSLVGPDSELLWAADFMVHHDVAPLADGSFVALEWEEVDDYRGRRVRFDRLVRVSVEGERTPLWSTFEHLEALQALHPPLALDTAGPPGEDEAGTTYDYYHLNSVEELGPNPLDEDERFRPGNLLVSARNANLIFMLDPRSGDVVWHWRPGTIDFQHMPTMTTKGTILLFDNGHHRGWSRLLEIDPFTFDVVWRYHADPREDFFTKGRGSNQRLPNGNTLACESERGRVFEVTPEGSIVWEFWNPDLHNGKRRRIYRFLRVEAECVEPFLEQPR